MMDPSWDLKRWQKDVYTVGSPVNDPKIDNHRSLKSKLHYFPNIFQHGKGRVFKVKYFNSSYDPLNPSFILDLITSILIKIYHLMWIYMVFISWLYLLIYLFLMIPRVSSLVMPFKNISWSSKGATPNILFVMPRMPSQSCPSRNSLEVPRVPHHFAFKNSMTTRGKYRCNFIDCYHLLCCLL